MANPTCTQASILNSCFISPTTINERQQKALLILAKLLELAAIGGTDYNGRMNLMFADAASLTCGMLEQDRAAALLQIAFNKAIQAGAPVPATMNGKQAAINCFMEATDKQLDEALVLLECKLGVNKSYPQ